MEEPAKQNGRRKVEKNERKKPGEELKEGRNVKIL
jgi:hypothetical protein